MKRLALAAAILTIAACTTKDTKTDAAADSAAMMAPAPAPAASDTGMRADSAATTTPTKP
jgi:hypothetical protein